MATKGEQGKPGLQDSSRENVYQVAKGIRVNGNFSHVHWECEDLHTGSIPHCIIPLDMPIKNVSIYT